MPESNVTPFRPRRPPPRPKRSLNLQSQRGKALFAQAMTFAAFLSAYFFPTFPLNFISLAFGVAAVAVATSNRYEGMPWARTHHEHATRTVLIGAAVLTILSLLQLFRSIPMLGEVSYWVRLAAVVWACARSGIGFGLALFRRPIPHPMGPLL